MDVFREVLQAVVLFVLAMIAIPVGIFMADLIKDYHKKEVYKNDLARCPGCNKRG